MNGLVSGATDEEKATGVTHEAMNRVGRNLGNQGMGKLSRKLLE